MEGTGLWTWGRQPAHPGRRLWARGHHREDRPGMPQSVPHQIGGAGSAARRAQRLQAGGACDAGRGRARQRPAARPGARAARRRSLRRGVRGRAAGVGRRPRGARSRRADGVALGGARQPRAVGAAAAAVRRGPQRQGQVRARAGRRGVDGEHARAAAAGGARALQQDDRGEDAGCGVGGRQAASPHRRCALS
ncbi:Protein of unknown function [Gryllus bimaculatus]|nr:Protein of unknown function [Gryllus bimaculatus]